MVKPYHVLNERFGLVAVREMELGCGITLDICTHVFTRVV